jgi:CRISP-associated protein Cas1
MGTIYVTQPDAYIGKTDERLQVKANKKCLLDVPLIKIEGVVVFGRATISPAAIIELLERKIPLTFLTETGKYLGCLQPELTKNIFVRSAQWEVSKNNDRQLHVVRGFIRGKLKNYRNTLLRARREGTIEEAEGSIASLDSTIQGLKSGANVNTLRGLEGAGSAVYFGLFGQLIRNPEFKFTVRTRRPPTDPVNALLSLGYTLLLNDIKSALNMIGFDPYLGYLHVQHYGRPSLALDLMEEFRPIVVDAFVLAALNRKEIMPEHFTQEPISNAVFLTKEGWQVFLRLYEKKKQSEFKHPVLNQKCSYQRSFEIQCRLLAKYLMGETDKYPPLILK